MSYAYPYDNVKSCDVNTSVPASPETDDNVII